MGLRNTINKLILTGKGPEGCLFSVANSNCDMRKRMQARTGRSHQEMNIDQIYFPEIPHCDCSICDSIVPVIFRTPLLDFRALLLGLDPLVFGGACDSVGIRGISR